MGKGLRVPWGKREGLRVGEGEKRDGLRVGGRIKAGKKRNGDG